MAVFTVKMALKEMAEEDIYFAKRDRELIEALHKKRLQKVLKCGEKEQRRKKEKSTIARGFETHFKKITTHHNKNTTRLAEEYRKLLSIIKKACTEKGKT